ncbi:hypothetical protein HK105_202652 [Polyrhizophydium stewartii]|uniref:histone deacetylase n=1 Tax=Polyrhizophydium stewartii TaxID=2732419 RepID=A0ABR4NE89_9FUNG|nr:Histone deacetylase 8 [Polyrhizophydium stewartii]
MAVALVHCDAKQRAADRLPSNAGRSTLVHALIEACGLLCHVDVVRPKPADAQTLAAFHSAELVRALLTAENRGDGSEADSDLEEELSELGLIDDCYVFPGLADYVTWTAGASITAARLLVVGSHRIAINWDGGRHHARRDEAAGFCHVNDVVLAILHLHTRFSRVLYLDLDVHHGDGKWACLQHQIDPGFFPGTGTKVDAGIGRGAHHALNVPLRAGARGSAFVPLFTAITQQAVDAYSPDAIVMQCGCDGLSGDPLGGGWNLDTVAIAECVKAVTDVGRPTLLLGGGGYAAPLAARCWTLCTAVAAGVDALVQDDIPEHEHLGLYAPDFGLRTQPGNMRDLNDADFVGNLTARVLASLDHVRRARLAR